MNFNFQFRFLAIYGVLFAVLLCATFISAQSPNVKSAIEAKKALSGIVHSKRFDQPFILLTPSDLSGISNEEISAFASAGDPCMMAAPITFGQSVNGELTNTDCRLDDLSYADFYTFDGLVGEQMQIDMSSGVFDSYLGVANESGTWVLEDDDGGGGTTARIIATLPESGTYFILANSTFPNQFGAYHLRLLGGPNCTFTFTPASASVPAVGGTFSFNVTTGPRCYWAAGSLEHFVTTNSTGLGNGTVTYNVAPNTINQSRTTSVIIRDNFFRYNYFYVTQAAMACVYSVNPSSVNVGPTQSNGSFNVTAPQGCFWSAEGLGYFLSATGWANGNGTVNYTVSHNNGADRSGTIRVFDQNSNTRLFTVNQTGLNCTYSVTPRSLTVPAAGYFGNYVVSTQGGCTWFLANDIPWIEMPNHTAGSGPATIPFRVQPHILRSSRSGAILFAWAANEVSNSLSTWFDQNARLSATVVDYDGDAKTDVSIFRPGPGEWWVLRSSDGGNFATQFGASTDRMVPVDFTGDGKTDIAYWRPSTGFWTILRSENFTFFAFPFGSNGDIPAPADFDGDGKADAAVFRPSTVTWFISRSGDGGTTIQQFGAAGDLPVTADYDGDGKADIAIYRPNGANGAEWWISRSTGGVFATVFGISTDKTVQGDYTGDGKADIAFWRPSNGNWFILRSENLSFFAFPFGATGDVPVPGDYDGDGKTDAGVFRPSSSTWFAQRSTAGTLIQQFGIAGDLPTPNAFVR